MGTKNFFAETPTALLHQALKTFDLGDVDSLRDLHLEKKLKAHHEDGKGDDEKNGDNVEVIETPKIAYF